MERLKDFLLGRDEVYEWFACESPSLAWQLRGVISIPGETLGHFWKLEKRDPLLHCYRDKGSLRRRRCYSRTK